jgi:hypothetical protein
MKNLIAAALMTLSLGLAAVAEPVEKLPNTEPAATTPVVTNNTQTQAPAQPEIKKDEKPADKTAAQTQKPAPTRKPVELKFRDF